jgi:uncharacterized protein (DUF433 family)
MSTTIRKNGLPTPSWTVYEPWQLQQLQRLAKCDPERAESILNTVWAMYPALRAELAVAAVEQGEITVEECCKTLGWAPAEVERQVATLRQHLVEQQTTRILETERGARVEDSQVFVWEIVREYRKLGSVDRLTEAFPGLSVAQLGSALAYARTHPQEIECAISAYEDMQAKKRLEYPYA